MAACGPKTDRTSDSAAGTVGATTAATTTGATTAAQPTNEVKPKDFNDAQILGAQEGADSSEIAVAKVAETMASTARAEAAVRLPREVMTVPPSPSGGTRRTWDQRTTPI